MAPAAGAVLQDYVDVPRVAFGLLMEVISPWAWPVAAGAAQGPL
jgi:hypothetical protein